MVAMVPVKINGKYNIILPKHRADRPEWYRPEGWEKARIEALEKHLTKEDTLFYIGAEEGDIAALCARWVKNIVLFEPNDKVWPNIKAIWEANNIPHPYCFSGFASDKTTTLEDELLIGFPASADGKVIGDHGFKELKDPGEIPQIRIDDILMKPTAITFDVEGSEWQVLKGAEQTIKKHKPKIFASIHPEFMFAQYGQYSGDFRKWIKDFGYKETILDYQHELHTMYLPI